FNQQNQSQPIPKDIATWSKHFNHTANVSFMGENLSVQLLEKNSLNSQSEKAMENMVNKISIKKFDPQHERGQTATSKPILSSEELATIPESISLDQINELHQKLLEHLRKSGALKDQKVNDMTQRQALEPTSREILDQ